MFFSELGILFAAAGRSQWFVLGLFAATISVVFVGVMTAMLPMVFGSPSQDLVQTKSTERRWRNTAMLAPAALLLACGFGLGVYQPEGVRAALTQAAQSVAHVSPEDASGSAALATGENP